MTRLVKTTATGAAAIAVCFGFGWSIAEVWALVTHHADHA